MSCDVISWLVCNHFSQQIVVGCDRTSSFFVYELYSMKLFSGSKFKLLCGIIRLFIIEIPSPRSKQIKNMLARWIERTAAGLKWLHFNALCRKQLANYLIMINFSLEWQHDSPIAQFTDRNLMLHGLRKYFHPQMWFIHQRRKEIAYHYNALAEVEKDSSCSSQAACKYETCNFIFCEKKEKKNNCKHVNRFNFFLFFIFFLTMFFRSHLQFPFVENFYL